MSSRKTIEQWTESHQAFCDAFPEFAELAALESSFVQKHLTPNSVVLDVGCGVGKAMKQLAPHCGHVIGIDNNLAIVELGCVGLAGINNALLLCCDAQATCFAQETFDSCYLFSNTFGNFADKKITILHELNRVLKSDGQLFLSVFRRGSEQKRLNAYKAAGMHTRSARNGKVIFEDGFVSEDFTADQIVKMASQAGFRCSVFELNSIEMMAVLSKVSGSEKACDTS